MNKWLAGAGGLAGMITLAHIIGGGVDVHRPLLESQADAELGAYISVLWHGVTAALLLMTVALGVATFAPQHRPALAWVGIALSGAFAMMFIGYGLQRLESVMIMPQWTVFLLIALLAIVGIRRPPESSTPRS